MDTKEDAVYITLPESKDNCISECNQFFRDFMNLVIPVLAIFGILYVLISSL